MTNYFSARRVTEVKPQLHRVAVDPQVRRGIPHNSYPRELPYKENICACCQYELATGDSVFTIPSCGVATFFKNIRNISHFEHSKIYEPKTYRFQCFKNTYPEWNCRMPKVRREIPHNSYPCELPYKEKICACYQYEFATGDSVFTIPSCGVATFFKNIRSISRSEHIKCFKNKYFEWNCRMPKVFTRLINNHTFATAARVAEVRLQLHRVAVDAQVRRGIPHNSYACELPYKEKICACYQYEFATGDSVFTIPSCGVATFFKNIRSISRSEHIKCFKNKYFEWNCRMPKRRFDPPDRHHQHLVMRRCIENFHRYNTPFSLVFTRINNHTFATARVERCGNFTVYCGCSVRRGIPQLCRELLQREICLFDASLQSDSVFTIPSCGVATFFKNIQVFR
ncbi:hypothetical protein FNV43_RR10140 [Rhamnella rubrinervis]|uniref:Uncharacterized protein n=1 Tax=Rhamnella rubrinervis TaxID=2594499 RepID=A0A8K0HBB7_9ROSA|nr:hypothetical protein FNV43_RR10140 [Rhamnella rubrinervis]